MKKNYYQVMFVLLAMFLVFPNVSNASNQELYILDPISAVPDKLYIQIGEKTLLRVSLRDKNLATFDLANVKYTASDSSVLRLEVVDEGLQITGLKEGYSSVNVTADGYNTIWYNFQVGQPTEKESIKTRSLSELVHITTDKTKMKVGDTAIINLKRNTLEIDGNSLLVEFNDKVKAKKSGYIVTIEAVKPGVGVVSILTGNSKLGSVTLEYEIEGTGVNNYDALNDINKYTEAMESIEKYKQLATSIHNNYNAITTSNKKTAYTAYKDTIVPNYTKYKNLLNQIKIENPTIKSIHELVLMESKLQLEGLILIRDSLSKSALNKESFTTGTYKFYEGTIWYDYWLKKLNSYRKSIVGQTESVSLVNDLAQKDPLQVIINGEPLHMSTLPFISNGTTFVPFRSLFEKFGFKVTWDSDNQRIISEKDSLTIELVVGSKGALVNGKEYALTEPPRFLNGVTFVPLRFIGEASGYDVNWNKETSEITINNSK